MNLKNSHITLGELLDNPAARAVLQRRFPLVMKHPLLGSSRSITLDQLISLAGSYVSKKMIADTLEELQQI